ncbi:MAG: zinc metallopeptidase [Defluviitaleaceae bacterium]|nr:zinc metallopeptidase [Defluviitaleaceae bacterium]MCL2262658.1 zinc metallopeptidase [Defluviitaleaceae bacterium]
MEAMYMWGFDPLFFVLVLPALGFTLWAQFKVKSTFEKFSKTRTEKGITGAQAAAEILRAEGIHDVRIERVSGHLSDHFDPRGNVIRLSDSVHDAATVAAVGVAAHEAGHAIQYAQGYAPIKIRAAIIPVTSFGSKLAMPLIFIGMIMGAFGLINIGIILFGTVVVFQFVTLPVEFNASSRALAALSGNAMLSPAEITGSRKVLTAAALTYVAALAMSLAQLIRFIAMARRR